MGTGHGILPTDNAAGQHLDLYEKNKKSARAQEHPVFLAVIPPTRASPNAVLLARHWIWSVTCFTCP